jgi:hypothetical protein
MTFMKLFGKGKTKQDSGFVETHGSGEFRLKQEKHAEPMSIQIKLKKPDPDYRMKQDERLHKVLRETTEFGMDEIQIVIDQLKKRTNHVFYRERIAYLAGEIGKDIMWGYPNQMVDDLITYLLKELDGRPETIGGVGKDGDLTRITISQPNVAALASLIALEKISTNDEFYVGTCVHMDMIPELKRLHKTTSPGLRPCIRQTIMNIKAVCPKNPADAYDRILG